MPVWYPIGYQMMARGPPTLSAVSFLAAVAQSTNDIGDQVAQDSGAVGIIGFFIVGVIVVIGAAIHRKRRG